VHQQRASDDAAGGCGRIDTAPLIARLWCVPGERQQPRTSYEPPGPRPDQRQWWSRPIHRRKC